MDVEYIPLPCRSSVYVWNGLIKINLFPVKKVGSKCLAVGALTFCDVLTINSAFFINKGKDDIPFISIAGEGYDNYPLITGQPRYIGMLKRMAAYGYLMTIIKGGSGPWRASDIEHEVYSELAISLKNLAKKFGGRHVSAQ